MIPSFPLDLRQESPSEFPYPVIRRENYYSQNTQWLSLARKGKSQSDWEIREDRRNKEKKSRAKLKLGLILSIQVWKENQGNAEPKSKQGNPERGEAFAVNLFI